MIRAELVNRLFASSPRRLEGQVQTLLRAVLAVPNQIKKRLHLGWNDVRALTFLERVSNQHAFADFRCRFVVARHHVDDCLASLRE